MKISTIGKYTRPRHINPTESHPLTIYPPALFVFGAAAAVPSNKAPAKPVEVASTNEKAACSIQCTLWNRSCLNRPWSYSCDDRGNFRRRAWHPDCDKYCWCKCDSKA